MNPKPIQEAKNPLLPQALQALERAAMQAEKLAEQTGTALIIMQDGRIEKIQVNEVSKSEGGYENKLNKK